jgi:type I restriction enzyme S subunit
MSVPALRFKEFNEDWSVKRLGDLAERIGDGLHSTPVYDENGQYYFVNGNNLTNSKIEISENTKRVNTDEYLKHKIDLTTQSVLISINGTIGNLAFFNDEKVVLGKSACYINLKEYENKHFIFNLLQTSNITRHFDKELTGSTIKNLSLTTIKNTKAFFPSHQEQTKIANFLTAVDEKITQLTQKHDLLSQYKKGVMQQIFSQELRFKDEGGGDFPEWEEKCLGDVGENIIGLTYSPKNVTNEESCPIVLRSSNIQNDVLDLDDKVRVNTKIPDKLFTKKNDILICTRNGSQRLIGKNVLISNIDTPMTFGAFMSVFRSPFNRYIVHLFKTDIYNEQIQINLGATINQITTKSLNSFVFNFPSLKEQNKIANFLTAIDDKVNATQSQLKAIKQYKQGLLQRMFV